MAVHKTRDLNKRKENIDKMMFNDFSISEICDELKKDGLTITPKSLRTWLNKVFSHYQEYLIRNGWSRKKKISPSLFDKTDSDIEKEKEEGEISPERPSKEKKEADSAKVETSTNSSEDEEEKIIPLKEKAEDITVNESSPNTSVKKKKKKFSTGRKIAEPEKIKSSPFAGKKNE